VAFVAPRECVKRERAGTPGNQNSIEQLHTRSVWLRNTEFV
jgi:hypothetical protein